NVVDDHRPAMRQAHAPALDESLRDPHDGHRARVDRRRERDDDADATRAFRREPARPAAGVLQLRADLVLRVLLSDRALDGSARSALRRRTIRLMPRSAAEPIVVLTDVH